MTKPHILVVDDEKLLRWSLEEGLRQEGYEVTSAETGEAAFPILGESHIDLILLDIKLPGISGMEVLKKVKDLYQELPVIMLTGQGIVETAVEALKTGAYDYITKPFNLEELKLTVRKALENLILKREVSLLRSEEKKRHEPGVLICRSQAMIEVSQLMKKVAESEASTVLLQGESGTGKDLVARNIHQASPRRNEPFLEVNCAALPEHLLESELMGHEKGAFTDAKARKEGLFELAEGGTIYLDEIGEMKPSLQVKLLRLIETKRFRRVGGTNDIQVDVRIIASSNRDLAMDVREGNFREDLYYRLKVIPITLPPLRERKEDILPLIKHFITRFNREFRKKVAGVSPEVEDALLNYNWPGNIRELRNVIERAMILGDIEVIQLPHLPVELQKKPVSAIEPSEGICQLPSNGIILEELEKDLIRQAYEKALHNQTEGAKLLGLSRDVFRYKLKKHGYI